MKLSMLFVSLKICFNYTCRRDDFRPPLKKIIELVAL